MKYTKVTYLVYNLKGKTARKRFDDFNNGIKLFLKKKSGEMRLEEAKIYRMCLDKI